MLLSTFSIIKSRWEKFHHSDFTATSKYNRNDIENDIEIVVGDETSIKDLEYDILMVAALAEPKDRVFANIWEYVDEKTPVIYRTYTGMRAILYSPVLDKDTRGFHTEVMMLPSGKTNNTSVLIRKII